MRVERDVVFMRDQDDRVSIAVQPREQRHDLNAGGSVQVAGRFVCKKNRRIVYQRAGDRHALPLAAGQLIWLMHHPVGQIHLRQSGFGFFDPLGIGSAVCGKSSGSLQHCAVTTPAPTAVERLKNELRFPYF